jgi:hypothetical protein
MCGIEILIVSATIPFWAKIWRKIKRRCKNGLFCNHAK